MKNFKAYSIFKFILLAGFVMPALFCSSQTDTLKIRNSIFLSIKTTVKNEFGSKDTLLKFYRLEAGEKVYLLTHYLYKFEADCNNEFTDLGTYEIRNDSLIFNTSHEQKTGIDPIPVQSRQIYIVQKSGKLKKVFDKVLYRDSKTWVSPGR